MRPLFYASIKPKSVRGRKRLAATLIGLTLLAAACGTEAESADRAVAALPESANDVDGDESTTGKSTDGESTNGQNEDDNAGEGPELSAEEAELAFSQCLADYGIDDPFGSGSGETIGDDEPEAGNVLTFESDEEFEAFEEAQEKCGEILEDSFGDFNASPEQEAEIKDAELKFSQCMSERGFEMDGQGIEIEDGQLEELEAASAECEAAFDDLNQTLESEEG